MEETKVLLSVKDLHVKFKVRGRILTAIRGISLDFYEDESIAIVGESGSGKSVFTKTFAGMLDSNGYVDQGSIIFNDETLADTHVDLNDTARQMIAYNRKKLDEYSKLELGAKVYQQMKALETEKREKMTLSEEELVTGIKAGLKDRSVVPVFCGVGTTGVGTQALLQAILDYVPAPDEVEGIDPNGPTAGLVFKTVSDQFGKYNFIKLVSGKLTADMSLRNSRTGSTDKLGRLYTMCGKKTTEVKDACCGDIVAIGKMDWKTGDTVCDPKAEIELPAIEIAEPCYSMCISPKTKGQDDKIANGLARLNEEDISFTIVNNAETHQMVLSGAGDMQIDVLVSKLKTRFNVEAELKPTRVAYREKIRKTVQKQGRHKKQTGGSGQFGDVWIRFEPQQEQDDMIFAEEVFGGSVPKNFFPAVEKGLREACVHGPLAGYPVVNLKAVLYDGSYHPVDSSEIAFKTAAQLAYKAAMPEASPVLLEPIGELKVTVPDSYMGDVIGDLNKRRGRVMGMDPTGDGSQVISAEVPMAEMGTYAIDLRSMTQSRGSFTFHFVRYEDCPPAAQEKAIAEAKALAEQQ